MVPAQTNINAIRLSGFGCCFNLEFESGILLKIHYAMPALMCHLCIQKVMLFANHIFDGVQHIKAEHFECDLSCCGAMDTQSDRAVENKQIQSIRSFPSLALGPSFRFRSLFFAPWNATVSFATSARECHQNSFVQFSREGGGGRIQRRALKVSWNHYLTRQTCKVCDINNDDVLNVNPKWRNR